MATEDLAAWLLEQIAEDEAIAQALPDSPRLGGRPSRPGETYSGPSYGLSTFIRTISPARVLVECDAKRRIVEMRMALNGNPRLLGDEIDQRLEAVLLILALPYADRPGYREEWRPDTPG